MTSLPPHSPAELLLLLHKRHTPGLRQLLRVTFLDLLRQQVLVVVEEQAEQRHPKDPVRWQQYVTGGPALHAHVELPHEKPLLNAFRADGQLRISFSLYVRMIFQEARAAADYYRLIEANGRTSRLFFKTWFLRLTGGRRLTKEGEQLSQKIRPELDRLNNDLLTRMGRNPAEALQFASQLGAAVLLLPAFTSAVAQQLEHELQRLPEATPTTSSDFSGGDGGGSDSGGSWFGHGDTFDSHSASHGHDSGDSSSGDADGGGDSGGDGDSGCSGCGGCGGGD
jgi:hypothetical protein